MKFLLYITSQEKMWGNRRKLSDESKQDLDVWRRISSKSNGWQEGLIGFEKFENVPCCDFIFCIISKKHWGPRKIQFIDFYVSYLRFQSKIMQNYLLEFDRNRNIYSEISNLSNYFLTTVFLRLKAVACLGFLVLFLKIYIWFWWKITKIPKCRGL